MRRVMAGREVMARARRAEWGEVCSFLLYRTEKKRSPSSREFSWTQKGMAKWQGLHLAFPIKLLEVGKEPGTHGRLYLVHEDRGTVAFVSQSVPMLVDLLNRVSNNRICPSMVYHRLRNGLTEIKVRGWNVRLLDRSELEQLNRQLGRFSGVVVLTQRLDLWRCEWEGEVVETPSTLWHPHFLEGRKEKREKA
jgi:hypothetical protein